MKKFTVWYFHDVPTTVEVQHNKLNKMSGNGNRRALRQKGNHCNHNFHSLWARKTHGFQLKLISY